MTVEPQDYRKLSPKHRKKLRDQYVEAQDGYCAHCKGSLILPAPPAIQKKTLNMSLFPKGFLDHPVHLHHDHQTGMTIGAVHAVCNAVLWQYHGK